MRPDEQGGQFLWRLLTDPVVHAMPISGQPVSATISNSAAYLAGYSADGGDPGVTRIDLVTGKSEEIVASSGANVGRTVQLSRSGATLASAVCTSDGSCDLDVLRPTSGEAHRLGDVGGYLRVVGDNVAIIGPDPATWIAGISLDTGKELWRRSADEIWSGYMTTTGTLVQAFLTYSEEGSIFSIESIDASTGTSITVVSVVVTDQPVGLAPEVSSDDSVVVTPGYGLDDILMNSKGEAVRADIYTLDSGVRLPVPIVIGGV